MSDFIIGCSLTMAWCFESEQTPHIQGLLARLSSEEACVPSLWPLEVGNALLVAERRKQITPVPASQFVSALRSLPIRVDPHDAARVWDAVLPLARSQRLSSYDAT